MADANTNFNYIFCISIENGMFFLHKGSNRQQIKLVLVKALGEKPLSEPNVSETGV